MKFKIETKRIDHVLSHIFLFLVLSVPLMQAQTPAGKITLMANNQPIEQVFKQIGQQVDVKFLYSNTTVNPSQKITLVLKNSSLEKALEQLSKQTGLLFRKEGNTVTVGTAPLSPETPSERGDGSKKKQITGTVTDDKGEPVIGANVSIKGTTVGTITDLDGRFSMEADRGQTLWISYVGYTPKETPVSSQSVYNISLTEDMQKLDEVVVIGYGVVKKSDLTGSVGVVKSKEVTAYPTANIMSALSGKSAGVQIKQSTGAPGTAPSVRIRGTNSIQGNNDPLYVVDGFPVSGAPTNINNSDIESIEILKDASATAIYGSRGANGVVMITTKKGKAGVTKVDFSTSYSTQSPIKKLDLMNAREYATFYNIQQLADTGKEFFTQEQINGFGQGYNWQDMIFRNAPIFNLSLGVSGGSEKTQFAVNGSVYTHDGIIKGSNYKRYSVQANLSHKISKMVSFDFSSTISRLDTDRKDNGAGSRGNSMISSAISAPPTLTPYNDDGSYRILARAYPFVATDLISPANFINEQSNNMQADVVLANAAFLIKPIQGMTIKIMGGIENRNDENSSYRTRKYVNSSGLATLGMGRSTSLLSENTISYQKTVGKHTLSAVAGFTYQNFLAKGMSSNGTGFLSDVFDVWSLQSAISPGIANSSYTYSALMSYLARANYNYADKYLATVSIRRDGSSRYSPGNKWGNFPSAALAWRATNEEFLKDNVAITDLKVRTSWGLTGSQAISPYVTLNTLLNGKTVFDDALYNTFAPGTRLPGNLKWETTEQFDVGVDLRLFQRFGLTLDYYVKNTRDLLNTVSLPTSSGYTNTIQNVGEVQNKGFEITADANIFNGPFKWTLNGNISFNRNKVIKLYGGQDILGGRVGVVVINDNTNILREGRPIGQFWGYLEDGYDDKGQIKFVDLDESGAITAEDKTYIGDPNPDFTYGINSSMSFKNFDLNIFLEGSQGNDIFNASAISNTIDYGFGLNMPREVLYNHWTPDRRNAKYPAITYKTTTRVSDRFIEDGSFLRLRNIQLAYNLPVKKWGVKWINNIQVYASAQNLFTITNYSWWDVEVNSYGEGISRGIDHNSYPSAKSFTFGLNVGF